MSIRNDLLKDIFIVYGGSDLNLTMNQYLTGICLLLGVTPRNEHNRNMLLEDILNILTGGEINTDWASNGDWADNGDWA